MVQKSQKTNNQRRKHWRKNQIHLQPFFALQTAQQFLSLRFHCYDPVQKCCLDYFLIFSTWSFCLCFVVHHTCSLERDFWRQEQFLTSCLLQRSEPEKKTRCSQSPKLWKQQIISVTVVYQYYVQVRHLCQKLKSNGALGENIFVFLFKIYPAPHNFIPVQDLTCTS